MLSNVRSKTAFGTSIRTIFWRFRAHKGAKSSLHNGAGHCRLRKFADCSQMILVLLPAVSSLLYRAHGGFERKAPKYWDQKQRLRLKLTKPPQNVCKWDRTSLPTDHLWTQNGSDLQPNFRLSIHTRIGHRPILGPISVHIQIGHTSEYSRVLSLPLSSCTSGPSPHLQDVGHMYY